MAIVINDPYARGGGGVAGQQLGNVLSTGLQQLAQTKMQNMQRRQQAAELSPLVGNNSQLANLLAGNPKLQQEYFKQQWGGQQGQGANPEFNSGLNQLLGLSDQPAEQEQPQAQMASQQAPMQQPSQGQVSSQAVPKQAPNYLGRSLAKIPANATPAQAVQYAKLIQDSARKDAEYAQKQAQAQLKSEQKIQDDIIAKNKAGREDRRKRTVAAREAEAQANKILGLLDSGEVYSGLRGHYTPKQLQNKSTQEFVKATQKLALLDFALSPGRKTKAELEAIEKTKPDLYMQPEAQKELAQEALNKARSLQREAKFEDYILAQNGGKEPAELDSLIQKMEEAYQQNPDAFAEILGMAPAKEQGAENPKQQSISPEMQQEAQPPKQGPTEETYPQAITRNIYRGGKKLAQLAGLPGTIAEAFFPNESKKTLLPTMQSIEENIFKPFEEKYLPKGYGQSKGDLEDISDMMAQSLPMIVFGGLPALAASAGSAVAIKGAERAGAGPLGQFAAGMVGGVSPRLLMNKIAKGGIRNQAIKQYTKDYKAAEPIAKQHAISADGYKKAINQEWDKLHSGSSGIGHSDIKRVSHEIKLANQDIVGDKVNVLRAWDRKKHLNKLIKNENDPNVKQYLKSLVNKVNEKVINPAAKEFPDFGIPYQRAEDLYIGVNAPNAIRKIVEEATSLKGLIKNPLAKVGFLGATAGGLKLAGIPGVVAGTAGTLATRSVLRTADLFWKSQEARNIMKDIGRAALNDDKAAIPQYLSLLNKAADNYEKKNPEKSIK